MINFWLSVAVWFKRRDIWIFLKAWTKNPKTMGAITPSSKYLAQAMVSHCNTHTPQRGIIVELGAGTGVVTAALLQSGVNPKQLVVLECSSVLVKKLRLQFSGVRVIEGSAIYLETLLKDELRPIDAIISSLPLRAFSKGISETILRQITTLLKSQGKYIQFTYSWRKTHYAALTHYPLVASQKIWRNCPPARIDVWKIS